MDADFEEEPEPGAESPPPAAKKATGFKEFLRSMPHVGDDADFERPH